GNGTSGTGGFLTAVDDLGDAEGSQLGKCGRIIALDSVPAREVHTDRFRRHRIVWIDTIRANRPPGQDAISSTTRLADRLLQKTSRKRRSQMCMHRHTASGLAEDGD